MRTDYILYKVYSNSTGKGPVVECVGDITLVVWQPPFDVVIHAPTWPKHSVPPPPTLIVEAVGIRVLGDHGGDITVIDTKLSQIKPESADSSSLVETSGM